MRPEKSESGLKTNSLDPRRELPLEIDVNERNQNGIRHRDERKIWCNRLREGKMATEGSNSISDHAHIILESLDYYRRCLFEEDDSDKKIIKELDDAIKSFERFGSKHSFL
jgi:hypothetical protein